MVGQANFEPSRVALGAATAIFDPDGRVLLVRHTYGQRNWELPGGLAEAGEDPASTARRELPEETGLDLPSGELTGLYALPRPLSDFTVRRIDDAARGVAQVAVVAKRRWLPPSAGS